MNKIDHSTSAPPSSPVPDISKLSEILGQPIDIRSVALTGLFIYASVYILMIAKAVFLPIAIALVFSFLLAPFIRLLKSLWIPESLGAALVLMAAGGIIVLSILQLSGPAADWISKAPEAIHVIETKLEAAQTSILHMSQASEVLEKITTLDSSETPRRRLVELKEPGLSGTLIGITTELLGSVIATAILLYFFLASGDLFLEKLVKVLPNFSDKKRAVQIVRDIEISISTHLITVTAINIGLGVAIAIMMYGLGMPNPILWGVVGGVLNFVPYVGSIFGIGIVTLVAALTFQQFGWVLLVGFSYWVLTAIEGTLLTPMILGKRLTLNPVVVLLSVFLWGWLWGILGTLLAVPLVACFKIMCDHLEPLASIGEFLGR